MQALDRDALRCVFKLLDMVSLGRVFQTCTACAAMAEDEDLFRALAESTWPGFPMVRDNVSWKARCVALWRAETEGPTASSTPDMDLSHLNDAYELIVHVRRASSPTSNVVDATPGALLAVAKATIELTQSEVCAGPGMGEGFLHMADNVVSIIAMFEDTLHIPEDILDGKYAERQEMRWADVSIHVARKSDDRVAHLVTGCIDHYSFQGDGFDYGNLHGVGVGRLVINDGYRAERTSVPWASLITKAHMDAPANGSLEGEIELDLDYPEAANANDEDPHFLDSPPPVRALRMKFAKGATSLGEGPWAPCFSTPLTLPDMPGILNVLKWA
jgi:hypothetical protein